MSFLDSLDADECGRLEAFLDSNGDELDSILVDFLKEYLLFGHFPFIKYHQENLGNVSSNLDFYSEPLSHIHPLKRATVSALLESDIPDTVDKIIIFGSSVTLRCNRKSDLDLYLVGSFSLKTPSDKEWIDVHAFGMVFNRREIDLHMAKRTNYKTHSGFVIEKTFLVFAPWTDTDVFLRQKTKQQLSTVECIFQLFTF